MLKPKKDTEIPAVCSSIDTTFTTKNRKETQVRMYDVMALPKVYTVVKLGSLGKETGKEIEAAEARCLERE